MPFTTPLRSPGIALGYLLIGLLLLLILTLLLLLVSAPWSWLSFFWGVALLLSVLAFFAVSFWTSALGVARYAVEGDALHLSWGRRQHTIPLAAITHLDRGEGYRLASWRGVRWPGHALGVGQLLQPDGTARPLTTYATRPLAEQQLLFTETEAFGLSPADPAFAQQLQPLVDAARASGVPAGPVRATLGPRHSPIWFDRAALALLNAGLVLNLALFALLAATVGSLPATVPLHFDTAGNVIRSGSGTSLLLLPVAGFLWWLVDGVLGAAFYRGGQRAVALLVWAAGTLLQAVAWVAVLLLIT
ncbi:MAG: PH domain-containing protein [Anaerolineae bacterium]|nr:PH domain-containing protein [Anaerolineae bacterium]